MKIDAVKVGHVLELEELADDGEVGTYRVISVQKADGKTTSIQLVSLDGSDGIAIYVGAAAQRKLETRRPKVPTRRNQYKKRNCSLRLKGAEIGEGP